MVFCYQSKEGESLQQALDYVAPVTIQAPDRWPYAQESPFDHGKFFQILSDLCPFDKLEGLE